jgi:putative transposase
VADLHDEYDRGIQPAAAQATTTKGSFPGAEGARKLLFLVTRDITRKWTMPPQDWAPLRDQLALRFAGRFPADYNQQGAIYTRFDKLECIAH